MSAKAQVIDFLLSGYHGNDGTGDPLVGGTVTVTVAGTSNVAYVWDDRDKTLPSATGRSVITLDAYGRAEVYGDGIYKFVIKNAGGETLETIDFAEYLSILGGGIPADAVIYNEGSTGAVDRTVTNRLQERVSVEDYGCVGDGVTDNAAAITLIEASSHDLLYVPPGEFYTSGHALEDLLKIYIGEGRIVTTDVVATVSGPHRRGNTVIHAEAPPVIINGQNIQNAFDGEFITPHVDDVYVTGATTAGDPVNGSGYIIQDQTAAKFMFAFFESGKNANRYNNADRTGWFADRRRLNHLGLADAWHAAWNVVVAEQDQSIVGIQGVPAGGQIGGDTIAGVDKVILQNMEFNISDKRAISTLTQWTTVEAGIVVGDYRFNGANRYQAATAGITGATPPTHTTGTVSDGGVDWTYVAAAGYDVVGKSLTLNMNRSNDTAAIDQFWVGVRMQSVGIAKPDSAFQAVGPWRNGLDLAQASDITRAIALAQDQTIEFNCPRDYVLAAPQWLTVQNVLTGYYRYNAQNVYIAATNGLTGATPPTHTSGTVSDGGVDWTFVTANAFSGVTKFSGGCFMKYDSATSTWQLKVGSNNIINATATAVEIEVANTVTKNLSPTATNTYDSGGASNQWKEVHAESYVTNGNAGATGSFTTADAKTVTVENGIITSIV